jgi:PHD/YefM family antitoxin component YafN of YafNO toxin-antitoxin module
MRSQRRASRKRCLPDVLKCRHALTISFKRGKSSLMTKTIVSSRQFNQDQSGAKRAARKGPVIIADRGRPAHVLLSFEAYQKLTRRSATIIDFLAMPGVADIPFDSPRMGVISRAARLT